MHQRFIDRMEAGLRKLQAAGESGRLKDPALAQRRLGRLQERCWRTARAFDIKIEPIRQPIGKARLSITWTRDHQWQEWATLSEGCYLLRTNLTETDPGRLWQMYMQLVEAEWAFRIEKDELAIRPIWHHKQDRVEAHILVCFLAYALWKTLAQWMKVSGLGAAPRTLVAEFAKIKSGDVVLPTVTRDGRPGRTVRVRCVTSPDAAQKVLLHRLGLTLPQRLRYLEEVPQM
jgi:hypothetical protein